MLEWTHSVVAFESLGLSPVLAQIGPLALRWYSLAYIAGILFGWWYLLKMVAQPFAPMTRAQIDELITWITLGVIFGGRLAYVIFYEPAKFAANPADIVKLWEGGMSFHGGAFGVLLAVWLYSRSVGASPLRVLDYVAVATPVGLFFGRLANFVNGELWGRPTDGSWGIVFPGAGELPRHPSQLYEAGLEGLALFLVLGWLFWFTPARRFAGLLSGTFMLGYGLFRFTIEYFREPDAQLGVLASGLTMGQTLCLPMIAAGAWLIVTARGRIVRAAA